MKQSELREKAWIGDAVLSLFAREWILKDVQGVWQSRTETFKQMTSNAFLVSLGEPTKIEARIGEIYEREGIQAAFAYIEAELVPVFLKQRANKFKQRQR